MPLFEDHQLVPVGGLKSNNNYWNRYEVWEQSSHEYAFKATDEFFAAVLTINTKSGSTIEAYIR